MVVSFRYFYVDVFDFWATVCKTVRPVLSNRCLCHVLSVLISLSCLSVLSVTLVNCGQADGLIKVKLGMRGRPRPWPHCVRWGSSSPSPRVTPPIFGPFLLWPNGWMHQDATWYGCRAQPRGLCVRWGPSPSSPRRGTAPKFSTHVYCGQTAGWIKMVVGMQVGCR